MADTVTKNEYINIYNGTITKGGTDGSVVSLDGSNSNPISATLNSTEAESQVIKLAIRCESGYEVSSEGATISFTGTTASKWKVAYDSTQADTAPADTAFADTAVIKDIKAKNVIFWVKASSESTETPSNDTSVKLNVSAKILASETA